MQAQASRSQVLPFLNPRECELILLPTEQCNFRCTYCYEDFAIGRMKPDTISGVKNLITRRSEDLRSLTISWFGGEPLAAKDLVYEISEHAMSLSRSSTPFKYFGGMTTNAYFLDAETCRRLVELGVRRYQITLDGWREGHNQSRQRADKKGTFDRIWDHLLAMRHSTLPLDVIIRVHIQPHSVESVQELVTNLIREFADDTRFDLGFKRVNNYGGPNASKIQTLSHDDVRRFREELNAAWNEARLKQEVRQVVASETYVCYAARPNSLMVRADGSIGKCTVMLRAGPET